MAPSAAAIDDEQPLPNASLTHDVGAAQVDLLADAVGRAAERDDELVERARARGVEHVAEERRVTVGQELLGTSEAPRASCTEHESCDEAVTSRRRHACSCSNFVLHPSQQK